MTTQDKTGSSLDRRKFIFRSAAVAGAALASGAVSAGQGKGPKGNVLLIASDRENICATCQFWGAKRKVTPDGSSVAVKSLGWCNNRKSPNFGNTRSVGEGSRNAGGCNNRKSPNFGNTTGPQTGPMKVWEKWSAIS